jgi:hypothetical protein
MSSSWGAKKNESGFFSVSSLEARSVERMSIFVQYVTIFGTPDIFEEWYA